MSKKIPFRISARTARLIGRQNFPNSEGAIIELVKNSYDADSSVCILFFDNRFSGTPRQLTKEEYQQFVKESDLIEATYNLDDELGQYVLQMGKKEQKESENGQALKAFFQAKCKLYIIDNGEGMTDDIIEDFWMTIGTNNKELDAFTASGRVRTGAKGIGRFALDKLGDTAEMRTLPNPDVHKESVAVNGFLWEVDWRDFDESKKILNEIEADLIDLAFDYKDQVSTLIEPYSDDQNLFEQFETGTLIEIGNLRDVWDDASVGKLFRNLEVLIPPREERIFNIFLFSSLTPHQYGMVSPAVCDDYDYKVEGKINKDGKAHIKLYRQEFDYTEFPDAIYEREEMQENRISKESFNQDYIEIERTINELVPGLTEVDTENTLGDIGAFDFVFYFLKNSATTRDRERFYYREFNSSFRKKWLKQFGGVKLFRDNFRVRPYGEPDSRSFDWLQLGERASASPQGIGQKRGSAWRIRPTQISGIINISRLTNIEFEDTSSRYGLQENQAFDYFSKVIIGILEVFEKDRTNIGQALSGYYQSVQEDVTDEEVEQSKENIKNRKKERKEKGLPDSKKEIEEYVSELEEDAEKVAKKNEQLETQIEEMRNESNLLRILASNALTVGSFAHELEGIKTNLVNRLDEAAAHFRLIVIPEKLEKLPEEENPFIMIDDAKKDDEKLEQWLHYSLVTLRKDKRQRKTHDLIKYFQDFKKTWQFACDSRGIDLQLIMPEENQLKFKVFEAELLDVRLNFVNKTKFGIHIILWWTSTASILK